MNYLFTLCTIGVIVVLNSADKIFDYFEEEETLSDKLKSKILGTKKPKRFTDDFRNNIKNYGKLVFQVGMLAIKFLL